MTKRKEPERRRTEEESPLSQSGSEESSSDVDDNLLDVDFELFDPQPEHDFHGIKTLLRQLFDIDAQLFDLSALTDIILAQPLLGSTVKVEGNETDPYAFLTVLNIKEHENKPAVRSMVEYLLSRVRQNANLAKLTDLLTAGNHHARIGLIMTERLLNIPSEVVPPMYKMLLEEISWALEDKEPYDFTHYLIMSKTYREVASALDSEADNPRRNKKPKLAGRKQGPEVFYFHPEDEVLQQHADVFGSFDYFKLADEGQSDSKRTFQELGIKPQGHVILIETGKFESAVKALQEANGQN